MKPLLKKVKESVEDLSEEEIAKIVQIQTAESILRLPIMECLIKFGVEDTKSAVQWWLEQMDDWCPNQSHENAMD